MGMKIYPPQGRPGIVNSDEETRKKQIAGLRCTYTQQGDQVRVYVSHYNGVHEKLEGPFALLASQIRPDETRTQ